MVRQGHANTARSNDGDSKHAAIYQKREESGENARLSMVLAVVPGLETDLGGDLEAPRAAASQERITDAHVAGSCKAQSS
jgi:hypothetical protein